MGMGDKDIRQCCYRLQTNLQPGQDKAIVSLDRSGDCVINLKGSLCPVTTKTLFTELESNKSDCAITSSCIRNGVLKSGQKNQRYFTIQKYKREVTDMYFIPGRISDTQTL